MLNQYGIYIASMLYACCAGYSSNNVFIKLNPYHAELIKLPHPLLLVSQSDYLIQAADTNSRTE